MALHITGSGRSAWTRFLFISPLFRRIHLGSGMRRAIGYANTATAAGRYFEAKRGVLRSWIMDVLRMTRATPDANGSTEPKADKGAAEA